MCWRPSIVCILKFEQMISEAYLLAMDSGPTLLAKKKRVPRRCLSIYRRF